MTPGNEGKKNATHSFINCGSVTKVLQILTDVTTVHVKHIVQDRPELGFFFTSCTNLVIGKNSEDVQL